MNQSASKDPFLPRDKPKSWIVFIVSGLLGVLIAGPIALSGIWFEIEALVSVGRLLLWSCWAVAVSMWIVHFSRSIAGHYKDVGDHDWKDQIW